MKKILLVEPRYRNKYPPLGLMKISAYYKSLGEYEVTFVKGMNKEIRDEKWDKIFVTTLFTFYFDLTIKTIKYYYKSLKYKDANFYIGGIASTIIPNEFLKALVTRKGLMSVNIIKGLLLEPNPFDENPELPNVNQIIDRITPDYSIINNDLNQYLNYEYETKNCYITYTTRGCVNRCPFCAVPTLEPQFCPIISIKEQIKSIDKQVGNSLRHLMLMDNNIMASPNLNEIVNELIDLGYSRGNTNYIHINAFNKQLFKKKYIDFNQGIDAREIVKYPERLMAIARLEITPLRIAFDDVSYSDKFYKPAMRLAAQNGFRTLSNYMLFNYKDRPEDLYERILINIKLNEEFSANGYNSTIWSFPMKYSPLKQEFCEYDGLDDHYKNRKWVGIYWNRKYLRGIQCILNATHGVVGSKRAYFNIAFGENIDEYLEIISMPESFIMNRRLNTENGKIDRWKLLYRSFTSEQKVFFINLIKDNKFSYEQYEKLKHPFSEIYSMYLNID